MKYLSVLISLLFLVSCNGNRANFQVGDCLIDGSGELLGVYKVLDILGNEVYDSERLDDNHRIIIRLSSNKEDNIKIKCPSNLSGKNNS